MKLSSGGTSYPTFTTLGDEIEGDFVKFVEQEPGKFGPKDTLYLNDGDDLVVRCGTSLSRTIKANLGILKPGMRLRLTYARDVPTNKGNPMKIIDVEAVDASTSTARAATKAASAPTPAAPSHEMGTEEDLPF